VTAEMKVTDAAVEAAIDAFAETAGYPPFVDGRNKRCMRAALEAALAAMLEPVGWQGEDIENNYTRLHETYDDLAKLEGKPWFRANRVYRIKPA
jgi:hypothetical protein